MPSAHYSSSNCLFLQPKAMRTCLRRATIRGGREWGDKLAFFWIKHRNSKKEGTQVFAESEGKLNLLLQAAQLQAGVVQGLVGRKPGFYRTPLIRPYQMMFIEIDHIISADDHWNWSDHISWCSIYENRRWSVVSLHQILKRSCSLLPPCVSNPEKSNPEIKKSNPEKVLFPPPIQAIHSLYRYPHTFSYLPGWDQISFGWNIDQNYQ